MNKNHGSGTGGHHSNMIVSTFLHQILPIREQLPTPVTRRRQWRTPLHCVNLLVLVAYLPIQNTWRLQRQRRKFSETSDEVRARFFPEFRFSVARIVISDPKCTKLGGESMFFSKQKCKNGSAYCRCTTAKTTSAKHSLNVRSKSSARICSQLF